MFGKRMLPLFDASSVDRFLKENAWWMALAVLAVLALVVALLLLLKPKKKPAPRPVEKSAYLSAMGGEENIVSHLRKGSRIELVLKDYSLLDKERLKAAGVDSFILRSNKLTLVIQGDAERVEKTLFGEGK